MAPHAVSSPHIFATSSPSSEQLEGARRALRTYALDRVDELSFHLMCALLLCVAGAAVLSTAGGAMSASTGLGVGLFGVGVVVGVVVRFRLVNALRLVAEAHGLDGAVARREVGHVVRSLLRWR